MFDIDLRISSLALDENEKARYELAMCMAGASGR
jgi:hypothetical protein